MALWHLVAGLPGLFFDQEYGIVAVAPVLAMASVGWWRLWRRDAAGRTLVVETALPLLALAVTVGAYAMWWGGSAPPGRQLVAALPLLGVPLAALWRDLAEAPARRALLVVLLGVGIATTGTLVFAREGLLIANDRDGASELLGYLAPGDALSRIVPSFTADRTALTWPLALLLVWAGVVAALWWLAGRVQGACCQVVRDWPLSCASAIAVLIVGDRLVPATARRCRVRPTRSRAIGCARRLRRHGAPGRDRLRPVAPGAAATRCRRWCSLTRRPACGARRSRCVCC